MPKLTKTRAIKPRIKIAKKYTAPDGKSIYLKGRNHTSSDNELYRAFARFCDALGHVWNLIESGPDAEKTAVKVAHRCCTGRLMIIDNQTGRTIEPNMPYEVCVLQTPAIDADKKSVSDNIKINGENALKTNTAENHHTE